MVVTVGDANVFADSRDHIEKFFPVDNCGMRSDLLNEVLLGISDNSAPVGAAVGLGVFNMRIGSHLF
jgi:hypothetical protein